MEQSRSGIFLAIDTDQGLKHEKHYSFFLWDATAPLLRPHRRWVFAGSVATHLEKSNMSDSTPHAEFFIGRSELKPPSRLLLALEARAFAEFGSGWAGP